MAKKKPAKKRPAPQQQQPKRYTRAEADAFIRANWETMIDQEMADVIGYSLGWVRVRRSHLGLVRGWGPRRIYRSQRPNADRDAMTGGRSPVRTEPREVPPTLTDEEKRHREEMRGMREANQRLQRQLIRAKAKTEDLVEAVYQAARDATVAAGRGIRVPVPKHDARTAKPEVALVHATDWQIGKRTESYSLDVAEERVALFAQKVVQLTAIQRTARPIRECVIMLGGDMVEGVQIFPGQAHELDATLFQQLMVGKRAVETFVRTIAADFERIRIYGVPGNHGRLGRRGDYPREDNADLLLYAMAEDLCRDVKHATWHIDRKWHAIIPIGNYLPLLTHGDQVKGFGGNIPAYGIQRKHLGWKAGALPPFTDGYVGHFHSEMQLPLADGGSVYVTGTPESGNEYAKEFCAATGMPKQRLHFIDPEKGRPTCLQPIYL